jgi:hypothetical protein
VARFSNYDGPASFTTLLNLRAKERGIGMVTLVAEIPAYIQGTNPKCIESVSRTVASILEVQLDLKELRMASDAWEKRVNEAIEDEEELSKYILKLEEDYDNHIFDTQMGELKAWLEARGLQVD